MELSDFVRIARGQEPADLLIRNAHLVNVLSGKIEEINLAIWRDVVVGWGDYEAREEWDAGGLYLAPGFIDGHIHLESAMVTPAEYAKAVLPRGTTTIVTDCHEIANVLGKEGILYMLKASEGLPLDVFVMLPSCVPATAMETAGAEITAHDLRELVAEERVIGLGEMMNFPGVVNGFSEVLEKLEVMRGYPVDGHAPGLRGFALNAYIGVGIGSDHECVTAEEAAEKLAKGMFLAIREGSTAKNLEGLLPAVNGDNSRRCFFVSDDRHPGDLLTEGHIDYILRRAVGLGLDAVEAVRMATLNPSEYFRLPRLGAIAPGRQADLVVLEDLRDFRVNRVMKKGTWVVLEGELLRQDFPAPSPLRSSVHIAWEKIPGIEVKAKGKTIRVIGLVPQQIVTAALLENARVIGGKVESDVDRDILKICVFERHRGTGNVGIGFVKGFNLKKGALASTVAHDSHNVVAVGVSDEEILLAVRTIEKMGGGQVVVEGERILADLPLPVAGLMSDLPLHEVKEAILDLKGAARSLQCQVEDPFMALSFLALPVIPDLKITDRGLFDVQAFSHVPLFV